MKTIYVLALLSLAACAVSKGGDPIPVAAGAAEIVASDAPQHAVPGAVTSSRRSTARGPDDLMVVESTPPVRAADAAGPTKDAPPVRELSVAAKPVPQPPVASKPDHPPAAPVQTQPGALIRGTGPAPKPAAEPVAGHPMLPVWDDAVGPRPRAVSLAWAQSEVVLNLYEPPRATPMQVEFSLDGGPWLAARYGRVVVPDLGVGTYQVRCVAYPSRGTSWVMEPVVLERTAAGWRMK